jgi:hypothetical protein
VSTEIYPRHFKCLWFPAGVYPDENWGRHFRVNGTAPFTVYLSSAWQGLNLQATDAVFFSSHIHIILLDLMPKLSGGH